MSFEFSALLSSPAISKIVILILATYIPDMPGAGVFIPRKICRSKKNNDPNDGHANPPPDDCSGVIDPFMRLIGLLVFNPSHNEPTKTSKLDKFRRDVAQ